MKRYHLGSANLIRDYPTRGYVAYCTLGIYLAEKEGWEPNHPGWLDGYSRLYDSDRHATNLQRMAAFIRQNAGPNLDGVPGNDSVATIYTANDRGAPVQLLVDALARAQIRGVELIDVRNEPDPLARWRT